jgi:methylmalonyl-CoA mutase N-terminal domain/subunit
MKDRCGAKHPRSMMLRFHTQTAGSMLTAQQPLNNVARVALQAMASVLGGTQSLHTNSYDEALALPSEQAATIALRTQQIVAEESGVTDFIDPLAGSYAIESLTDQIERGATDYLERIDRLGGMIAAIQAGYVQREIQDKAYEWEKDINSKDRIIVGVNRYQQTEPPPAQLLRVDPAVEREQVERLARFKTERDAAAVGAALNALDETAVGDANLMPLILAAVEADVSLGEIVTVLAKRWGRHQEIVVI